ncbi:hypothetical protein [Streptomyces nitrosporeus]|uniref:hypothetical protein n=1 Tax=Streptomyces nitrosporeus TaxID=28894 RepID=UPI00167E80C5|nr:hypothetical protein [Streptomyces nitrosporeus]GGZ29824.1 hypothetical protein GCM10010327_70120 [Streptomyces nitrosporeus]
MSQYYNAEVHVRIPGGDLVTIYADGPGPAGMPAAAVRAAAEKTALTRVRGGRVEGSRVSTTGR